MKYFESWIVSCGLAGALMALILAPACSSSPSPTPRPAGATSGASAPDEGASSADPAREGLSPLIGRWSTRVILERAETLINLTIRRDGTARLQRVRKDDMRRSEATGMVSDDGTQIMMDDGLTYELKRLGSHLVAKRLVSGEEFVLKRL